MLVFSCLRIMPSYSSVSLLLSSFKVRQERRRKLPCLFVSRTGWLSRHGYPVLYIPQGNAEAVLWILRAPSSGHVLGCLLLVMCPASRDSLSHSVMLGQQHRVVIKLWSIRGSWWTTPAWFVLLPVLRPFRFWGFVLVFARVYSPFPNIVCMANCFSVS